MARVTLVIGNGFSIGFAAHLCLLGKYKSSYLLPGTGVPFAGLASSRVSGGDLWREDLFPELWSAWHRFAPNEPDPRTRFLNFCTKLANEERLRIAPGSLTLSSTSIGLQIRKYLVTISKGPA